MHPDGFDLITVIFLPVALLLIALWLLKRCQSKINLPPGPPGLPIIGNLHLLKKPPFLSYDQLYKKYGEIYYFRLGQRPMVVISSLELMKQCLSQRSSSGRIKSTFQDQFFKKSGLVFIDGDKWKFHRRLSLQIMRDFGMGKSLAETIVHNEAVELCRYLDEVCKTEENSIQTSKLFSCATMNIISQFTVAHRPGYEDESYNKFLRELHYLTNDTNMLSLIPVLFPCLSPFNWFFSFSKRSSVNYSAHEFVKKQLQQHVEQMSSNDKLAPKDYVEAYYLAREQFEKKEGVDSTKKMFNDWQIIRAVMELFAAGMDTSATSLGWTVLLLSLHDSVRERMMQEIHNVIGKEKIASTYERRNLPYTMAVIDEVMRFSSISPGAVLHRAMEDFKLGEYDIPKETWIYPNLYSLHHDPTIWERPHEFYPQHFLSEDGTTYCPREHLIPFGIGKRVCLGESLARTELFIMIVTLVQRYRFRVVLDEKNGETLEKCLRGSGGIVSGPGPHSIHFTKLQ